MKPGDIAEIIEKTAPLSLQESWDNSGFQLLIEKRVDRVLVAMEITGDVIDEAVMEEADLIVTHHPLIFGSVKSVNSNDITGNMLIRLIKEGISVYSSHTPFDKCKGGNNDCLATLLHLMDVRVMEEDASGICRTGLVDGECSTGEYIRQIESWLKIDRRFMSFSGDAHKTVKKVGLCTGSGAEFIRAAKDAGCDLFITGDVKYHGAQEAKAMKMNLLDIGHWGSEKIFAANMAAYLNKNIDAEIIVSQKDLNPFSLI